MERFRHSPNVSPVAIAGTDGRTGETYAHQAFVPDVLPPEITLNGSTWLAVTRANYAGSDDF